MSINNEVRRLNKKWSTGVGWPKRLEWIEIFGLRGWEGQRVTFDFPIVAIVGENGIGKSTLLQAAASVHRGGANERTWFPSEFFPDTAWDQISGVEIKYGFRQGESVAQGSIRKPTSRWLGHADRPERRVEYVDLNRIQPVGARVGYARIAKTRHTEASAKPFDAPKVGRLSSILSRKYDGAKMALSDIDENRLVPVMAKQNATYSGFHQGSGETMVAELIQVDMPKYGLVVIDEIESSLHPRAQRRLIRDLAEHCRDREVQIILTTHSPYVLEELPPEARLCILETDNAKKVVNGVSPQFALTKMDDDVYPECDLYVEDLEAKTMLQEILAKHGRDEFLRVQITPFGAASVGHALGQMVSNNRFSRPTRIFLDGDNPEVVGCHRLPGDDAPEQVVFKDLLKKNWGDVWTRVGRDVSSVQDACARAMTASDHHDWLRSAANELRCSREGLWQAMCAEWAAMLTTAEADKIVNPVRDVLP